MSPSITWYGSPNFTPGRTDVEYVVIHWMDGYLAGADATFQNTTRQTSAHYGVEDDVIHQYVDEANTAWHAGNYDANTRSIGIEHSAMPGRAASDATYASTIWLITGICQRYGLDPAVAILPHQHFTATSCPGTMDLPRIIAGVQAALSGVSTQSGTITPIQEELVPNQSDKVFDAIDGSTVSLNELLNSIDRKATAAVSTAQQALAAVQGIWSVQATDPTDPKKSYRAIDYVVSAATRGRTNAEAIARIPTTAPATPPLDVQALAAELAPLLTTNQAHQFIVALGQALPKE